MSGEEGQVFKEAISNFLAPVADLLADDTVSEILINGPQEVFVERHGKLKKAENTFADEDALLAAANAIAQSVGRRIDFDNQTLDARLPDGSRIHIVIPPTARNGTTISVRKFTASSMNLKEMTKIGSVTLDAAQFLDICMFLGKNVIVSGGTGSGKTTLLGVLMNRIPKGQRLLVIEDSSELQINYEHVVRFETQMGDPTGKGKVTMEDLLKSALRLRPDRIVVGEVRGAEALYLMNAMNTGHKGCMGTVHANTPLDAMVRLEGLAMGADTQVHEKMLRYSLASAVDIVVQISRFKDGSRRIKTISECLRLTPEGDYNMNDIFDTGHLTRAADGKLVGEIKPTGNLPTFMEEIEANNIPFPRKKFEIAS